jgi:hypothetical protein
MHRGYIKLWRKIQDSFFYTDSEAVHLWVHLLLEANHTSKEFMFNGKKITCYHGSFVTGRHVIARKTGINESKVYRLLKMLESEHLIEQQKGNRYSIITIVNYTEHQVSEQQNEQLVNNTRTTGEQQVNTTNTLIRTKKNKEEVSRAFAPPTLQEVSDYCKERKNFVDPQRWHDFYSAKGWMVGKNKMKDWRAAVRTWERDSHPNTTNTSEFDKIAEMARKK